MSRIEEILRRHRPRQPSADYVARGIERIEAGASNTGRPVAADASGAPWWRPVAVALALLLCGSVAVNVVLWSAVERPPAPQASGADGGYMVYRVLRPQGE